MCPSQLSPHVSAERSSSIGAPSCWKRHSHYGNHACQDKLFSIIVTCKRGIVTLEAPNSDDKRAFCTYATVLTDSQKSNLLSVGARMPQNLFVSMYNWLACCAYQFSAHVYCLWKFPDSPIRRLDLDLIRTCPVLC